MMPRRSRPVVAAILFAAALNGCAPSPHVDAAIGSIMTPGNTQVPLPPGEWRQLAIERHAGGTYSNGGIHNNRSVDVSYALVEKGRITSLVNVFTSEDANLQYIANRECLRVPRPEWTYHHEVTGGLTNYSDCVKVEKITAFNPPNANSNAFYNSLYQTAAELGGLPRSAVEVSFCDSLRNRYLHYYAFFFPERDGGNGDKWRVGELGPAEQAYVNDVVSWAKKFRQAVHNGTQNEL